VKIADSLQAGLFFNPTIASLNRQSVPEP